MRHLYSLLFRALLPVLLLRMIWRSRRAPAYRRRLRERLGYFHAPRDARPLIWVHAVSLGEVQAAAPLLRRILDDLPQWQLAVTTTTPTGSAQLLTLFGERLFHVYAPWDTPGAVRRCLKRLQPRLLLIMETELWPNLIHDCARRACPVVLANARLSQRSAAGYARFPHFTRQVLGDLSLIAAQGEDDARRFRELGAPPARVAVHGNLKFDLRLPGEIRARTDALRREWHLYGRQVLIVASTHDGEEALALEAFARVRRDAAPDALMILVPRHPERFDAVERLCREQGWRPRRRSSGDAPGASTAVYLLDTIGELLLFYGLADIAVVGGSFFDRGGHNPLEPAVWGLPILCGPSMFNFMDIADDLRVAGALEQVADARGLAECVMYLLADGDARRRRGAAGRAAVTARSGDLDRLFAQLLEALPSAD